MTYLGAKRTSRVAVEMKQIDCDRPLPCTLVALGLRFSFNFPREGRRDWVPAVLLRIYRSILFQIKAKYLSYIGKKYKLFTLKIEIVTVEKLGPPPLVAIVREF